VEWIVSLTPEAAADPMTAIEDPPTGASIVELRLDLFPEIDVGAAVGACPLPVLATLRSNTEGGEGPDDPTIRARIIGAARNAGAALLDLEFQRDASLVNDLGLTPEETILSWHDPRGTPEGLAKVAGSLFDSPARWIKVVPTATRVADMVAVLELHRRFNGSRTHERRVMTFAMGAPGLASRYLAPLLGPPVGYAAWSDNAPAAPGQLSIDRTESVIGHLAGTPQRIYGVVGADVSASLSPVLHAAGYRSLSLTYVLLPTTAPDPDEMVGLFKPKGTTRPSCAAGAPCGSRQHPDPGRTSRHCRKHGRGRSRRFAGEPRPRIAGAHRVGAGDRRRSPGRGDRAPPRRR
jgi:3-dehydroquinate dehydratase type I